ncbi:MAG TPA: response regulator [Gemmatimonadaceae bacterium]|nr:response regulator [Gemmatimonadaceae bacterium]
MPDRILIVEDSALVSEAFGILFTEAGYDVDLAATVAEAVERGTSASVDLMLLDLTLPDGDGLEVLDALRKKGSLPRATIAMTGRNDSESRRRCMEAGCAEVLLKPVPIKDLLRHVERLLA